MLMRDGILIIDYSELNISGVISKIMTTIFLYEFFSSSHNEQELAKDKHYLKGLLNANQYLTDFLQISENKIQKKAYPEKVAIMGIGELFSDIKEIGFNNSSSYKIISSCENVVGASKNTSQDLIKSLLNKWNIEEED